MLCTTAYTSSLCAGDIRLVNGSVPSEGRVELFYEGEWGRVVVSSYSSDTVARVACRQAGYPYTEGTGFFKQGSGPVWVVIWRCTGDEERVEQCIHNGWKYNTCPSCLAFGVRCRGECAWSAKDTHRIKRCLTTESYLRLSHHPLYLPIAADKRPFNVSIEATPFSVFIEWMEPSVNIPFVTGYNITMETMVKKEIRTVCVAGSSRKSNVTGLTPFMEYSFTVTAEYKYGAGPPSETVTQRTKEHGK